MLVRPSFIPLCVYVVLLACVLVHCTANEHVYTVEHNLGSGFEARNSVDLMFDRRRNTHTDPKHRASNNVGLLRFSSYAFSPAEISRLKEMAKRHDLYRLRFVRKRTADGTTDSFPVIASIPVCSLLASNFREVIHAHVDPYGSILAVEYSTTSGNSLADCRGEQGSAVAANAKAKLTSKGLIYTYTIGASVVDGKGPQGQPAQQVPLVSAEELGPDGEKKPVEEPSFFTKYYWYIMGFLVLMTLNNREPPSQGQGRAGVTGKDAPRAAVSAQS